MASFITPVALTDDALAEHIAQITEDLAGLRNIPISLTGINDAASYALTLKNVGTGAKGLIVYAADGVTTLLQVDANGVKISADGVTPAAGSFATLTSVQTLTNKTLTSPHMTGVVVDSGGLTVTAGNVGIGSAPGRASLQISGTINSSTTLAAALEANLTVVAQANSDNLVGLYVAPTYNANAKTTTQMKGIWVAASSVAGTSAAKFGIHVAPQTGANASNYGIYIEAPSGATTNVGILNDGDYLQNGSASSTTMTSGFVFIPSQGGAPTGVPTNRASTRAPLFYDSFGHKLWVYDQPAGAWKGVVVS